MVTDKVTTHKGLSRNRAEDDTVLHVPGWCEIGPLGTGRQASAEVREVRDRSPKVYSNFFFMLLFLSFLKVKSTLIDNNNN